MRWNTGNNGPQLSTCFEYPPEIREIIYTTNSIENWGQALDQLCICFGDRISSADIE